MGKNSDGIRQRIMGKKKVIDFASKQFFGVSQSTFIDDCYLMGPEFLHRFHKDQPLLSFDLKLSPYVVIYSIIPDIMFLCKNIFFAFE